ncbi:MAG TPA: NAD(P)/FAD-dependent oxidoreductase [Polyangiaceae bacterium]|nr:NAD(P)/FAD-dependent oxidoreductase [Polyangiaceae bacterium]
MARGYDAVVVGAGPNGLTAAAFLARAGLSVLVLEANAEAGGGVRTEALTLPWYRHDLCSAVHTMGCLSPAFELLDLERHGLEWIHPPLSLAHPLDGGEVVWLEQSIEGTAAQLGVDERAYRELVTPFVRSPKKLFADLLAPLGLPRQPFTLARFGLLGLRSARSLSFSRFRGERARALFAGCAGHGIQPLEHALTGAFGLTFLIAGHVKAWPVARGGSSAIASALLSVCRRWGVELVTGERVSSLGQLPAARAVLFDLAPRQVAEIAGEVLPGSYLRTLRNYRMGPACFKLDWALDGPIPWSNPEVARASTVHVGGTFDELAQSEAAVWRGEHPQRPFVLVTQQSHFDSSRAPRGKHTGYAYCHVPMGSGVDMTDAIEAQIERFAPGFRERILARHRLFTADLELRNASHIGGVITGGVADLGQLFTRPALRWDPYSTPHPQLFLCSQSTPPGGGVHGMCGFYAARSALQRVWGRHLSLPW